MCFRVLTEECVRERVGARESDWERVVERVLKSEHGRECVRVRRRVLAEECARESASESV